jgi:hypothetical protein
LLAKPDLFTIVTDSAGRFSLDVPAQRYELKISFVGFESVEQELLVTAAKSISISIVLVESITTLDTLEVISDSYLTGGGIINMPLERALRLPASYFDPMRAMISYPGVVQANDQANSLIIRGASPAGVLWRLNGLDILNPNHLSNAGTLSDKPVSSGGGVNMLSAQVLDRTQLITSAAPASYGNYTSGVMDLSLREGNQDKHEYTAQASLLGLDLAAEGPLADSSQHSYLVNYRYSTIGLLSQMGVNFGDEQINFQDISFQLTFNNKRSQTHVFGVGGNSKNEFEAKPVQDREVEKDAFNIKYQSTGASAGVTHVYRGQRSTFKMGAAYSIKDQNRHSETDFQFTHGILSDQYSSTEQLMSGMIQVQTRLAKGIHLLYGAMASWHQLDLKNEIIQVVGSVNIKDNVRVWLLQPWVSSDFRLSDHLTMELGLRGHQSNIHGGYHSRLDPRIKVNYHRRRATWEWASAMNSQLQPLSVVSSNANLNPSRIWQTNLSYSQLLTRNWRLMHQLYYHKLMDIPAVRGTHTSLINYFDESIPTGLTNSSYGNVLGWESLAEKRFQNQQYVIASISVYDSRYKVEDQPWRVSRFHGVYTFSISGGKEWKRKKDKSFGIHLRGLAIGGQRTTPILVDAMGIPSFDLANAFGQSLRDYLRLDSRFVWSKNKKNYTRSVSLDIQNTLGIENDGFQYFDRLQQKVIRPKQLGIIPILVYRVDF